jgi:hypothetical protein
MSEIASEVELGHHKKLCAIEIAPPGTLSLKLSASCHEDSATGPEAEVVAESQTFYVVVKWKTLGTLRRHICGRWCLKVAWESCGPGSEAAIHRYIDIDPCKDDYEEPFAIQGGDLGAGDCGTIYCLCVTLSSASECPDGDVGLLFGSCKDVCCIMVRPG